MFPTSTLPLSPFFGAASIGTLVGILAIGVLVALLVGLALHRREQAPAPTIELPATGTAVPVSEKPARTRLSA